ncbi:MAG: ATP-dependent Clp protease ATP-binding subunit [Patescibacteria group bacterium]
MISIFQKFTTHSRNALKNAFSLALSSGQHLITPQHILYGLSLEKGSIAAQILIKAKVNSFELKNILTEKKSGQKTITHLELTSTSKKILEKSFLISSQNQHKYIGTEHLLASILSLGDQEIIDFFQKEKINLTGIKNQIDTILNSTSKFPDLTSGIDYFKSEDKNNEYGYGSSQTDTKQQSILEVFATNLTDLSIQKKIDPVIGRQEEIDRLIQILCRRNKNNPLLLGDPGVGKTAIVEGLAKKIVQSNVPEVLRGKKIYALDLSLVVAGTSFRGEFENRLKQILVEVKKNPNIILFIDEIHNLIGVGSASGSMDAANILKPALARGEIRCIGATTMQDYKKFIESDVALDRRFQPIIVSQPSVQKTIEILQGIKENYENFHQVKINEQAIIAAAQLSERYIADRFLPDKAIDLIDEAASGVKIKYLVSSAVKEINQLENELQNLTEKKKGLVTEEKFSLALKYRQKEREILVRLQNLKNQQLPKNETKLAEITQKEIAQIVSKITGIPLADLLMAEKKQLLQLEKTLVKNIVGQNQALKSIAEFIRRSRTGISDTNRPIGSFIFLGPSGVGKTELAKVLAQTIFGSNQALIKIDMSEFAESFNISKLIGAPAGYIGYKDGTKLTDAVKHRPYSVVLFDEIEKAHHQIFSLLLQVLEDGCLTDGTGKTINFRNTIIIMTSNLGSNNFNKQAALGFQTKKGKSKAELEKGFEEIQREVIKKLKDKFPPEFLSRVDKTIVFQPLEPSSVIKIAKIQLAELKNRLAKQGLKINFDPTVAKLIAKISYSPENGARAIRKNIQELIESKLANKILTKKDYKGQKIVVKVKDNKIII